MRSRALSRERERASDHTRIGFEWGGVIIYISIRNVLLFVFSYIIADDRYKVERGLLGEIKGD